MDERDTMLAEVTAAAQRVAWADVDVVIALGSALGAWQTVIPRHTTAALVIYEPRVERRIGPEARTPQSVRYRVREALTPLMAQDRSGRVIFVAASNDGPVDEWRPVITKAYEEAARSARQRSASAHRQARAWTDHMLSVLPLFAGRRAINSIKGALRGVPAVIVSGGSRLDKNICDLVAARDRALVISAPTVASVVERHGVVPDVVMCSEITDTSPWLAGYESKGSSVLVPGLHCHEAVWGLGWADVCPAVSPELGFGEWLCGILGVDTDHQIPTGGSVSCLAAAVAHHLGCSPIVLIGQDCAIGPNGENHCSESLYGDSIVLETEVEGHRCLRFLPSERYHRAIGAQPVEGIPVLRIDLEGWDGGTVASTYGLDGYRQWFEDVGAVWRSRGTALVNATEGGARIDGWAQAKLRDVVARLDPLDRTPREMLVEALSAAPAISRQSLHSAILSEVARISAVRHTAHTGQEAAHTARVLQVSASESMGQLLEQYAHPAVESIDRESPALVQIEKTFVAICESAEMILPALERAAEAING